MSCVHRLQMFSDLVNCAMVYSNLALSWSFIRNTIQLEYASQIYHHKTSIKWQMYPDKSHTSHPQDTSVHSQHNLCANRACIAHSKASSNVCGCSSIYFQIILNISHTCIIFLEFYRYILMWNINNVFNPDAL